ncbi:hypothetical protein M569_06805 [Genlisea aurea]|uniref:DYW domain-containing protein n=1 Tax=Genlisea aurea TaxID=192259 RepID=S8CSV3_9LAMI|nr:hypothetical protein M569_06805 [Genlisea aurea]
MLDLRSSFRRTRSLELRWLSRRPGGRKSADTASELLWISRSVMELRNVVEEVNHRMAIFKCCEFLHRKRYIAGFDFLNCCRLFSSAALGIRWKRLLSSTMDFDSVAYGSMLRNCVENGDPAGGKFLHCDVLKRGSCLDLFGWNILLNLYMKHGLLLEGRKLFDEMPERNVVSFVTMIQGYSDLEMHSASIGLFSRLRREGHELNPFVFTTILKLLVALDWSESVPSLHACIHKLGHVSNSFVGTSFINAYSVSGSVNAAKKVFEEIVAKDMVCWTGFLACHAENDCFEEALEIFSRMRDEGFRPNNFTFGSVIKACIGLDRIDLGRSIHGCVLKTCYEMYEYVGVSLLDLYSSNGSIEDARRVFEGIPKDDDVVPWSIMIARLSQSDRCGEALDLFARMPKATVTPNQFTLASVLQSCATIGNLDLGIQIHSRMVKTGLDLNVFACNALMDVYAKSGMMKASADLFEYSRNRNDVSWNTMAVGYVQLGDGETAFGLFLDMRREGVKPTDVTYSCLLRASAGLASLEAGIQLHSAAVKTSYDEDAAVSNALVDMYAKCGRIENARAVFDAMSRRDVVSWNSMISAYSMHGYGAEALEVFENMEKSGIPPNQLTFVAALSACSNTGLLDQGRSYFASMREDYGIEPCVEHYTCMVSLLGRLGRLDEALETIEEMPREPSVMVWRALLGACAAHRNVELGSFAASRVLELEPRDESTHVLLSNVYARAKRFDGVLRVRNRMKRNRVRKEPGLSWVENRGTVHYFAVGDASHHRDSKLIKAMLEWLSLRAGRSGYVPDVDAILVDVEDDEKGCLSWLHSERIALAFALIGGVPRGCPIRIMKNLRICGDCHAAVKAVSGFVDREIVVRDINRFHHFRRGSCSCNDYW